MQLIKIRNKIGDLNSAKVGKLLKKYVDKPPKSNIFQQATTVN